MYMTSFLFAPSQQPRSGVPREGGLFGPAVVGLAARVAQDLIDHAQLARHLVAGDLGAAVRVEEGERDLGAGPRLHDGRDALAPLLVRHAHDDGVEHAGMRLERLLDLLRKDLLAAAVDADGAAPEHGDAPVLFD